MQKETEALINRRHTVNLHSHTPRCGHARGAEREYVERAIAEGMKVLGFSDHCPYPFPDGYYSGFRMHPEQQEDYVNTILSLKKEYAGQIRLLIGYEVEYYPAFFSDLLKMLTRYPVDYMIQGQHLLENEITGVVSSRPTDDPAFLRKYVDQTCEGMKTGVFTFLAHPDLCHFTGDPAVYREEYSRLIRTAMSLGIPLEINLLGMRDKRHYPGEAFFALCGELGAAVCIGSDAHEPEVVYDEFSRAKAMEMVRKYHLNLIESPAIIAPTGSVSSDEAIS